MKYLITTSDNIPFLTNWFDPDNNFAPEVNMVVYDLVNGLFTKDGYKWEEIFVDHL